MLIRGVFLLIKHVSAHSTYVSDHSTCVSSLSTPPLSTFARVPSMPNLSPPSTCTLDSVLPALTSVFYTRTYDPSMARLPIY